MCAVYVGIDLSLSARCASPGKMPRARAGSAGRRLRPAVSRRQLRRRGLQQRPAPHRRTSPTRSARRGACCGPEAASFAFDPNLLHPAMALFRHPQQPALSARGREPERAAAAAGARCGRDFSAAGFADDRPALPVRICPTAQVAAGALNRLLPLYNAADWLWETVGLGRWFGTFVLTWGRKPTERADARSRYSVVVPVFNEAENIGAVLPGAARALAAGLRAADLLRHRRTTTRCPRSPRCRPTRSPRPSAWSTTRSAAACVTRSRPGCAPRARRSSSSRWRTCPTTIAASARWSRRAEAGADVVCASRYMQGGRQIGGPPAQGLPEPRRRRHPALARRPADARSDQQLQGLPHATSCERTPIESDGGVLPGARADRQGALRRRPRRGGPRHLARPHRGREPLPAARGCRTTCAGTSGRSRGASGDAPRDDRGAFRGSREARGRARRRRRASGGARR